MTRMRIATGVALAMLAGAVSAGNAAAEPSLFQGTVVVNGRAFWTISNPGRIASVHGSNPASFEIAASLLGGAVTIVYGAPKTGYFSFMNEAGGFSASMGPGTAAFTPLPSHPGFRASFSGSPVRFGGTMRLLGHILVEHADHSPPQTIS